MDWGELLYAPHYQEGVGAAVLVVLGIGAIDYEELPALDLTIVDEVRGDEPDMHRIIPQLRFKRSHLVARGIVLDDLRGALVTMATGRQYRVESFARLPAPDGEESGEISCNVSEVEQ